MELVKVRHCRPFGRLPCDDIALASAFESGKRGAFDCEMIDTLHLAAGLVNGEDLIECAQSPSSVTDFADDLSEPSGTLPSFDPRDCPDLG